MVAGTLKQSKNFEGSRGNEQLIEGIRQNCIFWNICSDRNSFRRFSAWNIHIKFYLLGREHIEPGNETHGGLIPDPIWFTWGRNLVKDFGNNLKYRCGKASLGWVEGLYQLCGWMAKVAGEGISKNNSASFASRSGVVILLSRVESRAFKTVRRETNPPRIHCGPFLSWFRNSG